MEAKQLSCASISRRQYKRNLSPAFAGWRVQAIEQRQQTHDKCRQLAEQSQNVEVELVKCEGFLFGFGFPPVPSKIEPYVKVLMSQLDGTSEEFYTDGKFEDLNPKYGDVFEFCNSAVQWAEGSLVPATLVLEVWNRIIWCGNPGVIRLIRLQEVQN